MAGWAYTRAEPLPETAAQLEGAENRLVGAIKERDPDYRVRQRGRDARSPARPRST